MEGSKTRARVICNPTSGGGCESDALREELEDFGAEWIDTKGAGDAQRAAEEWSEGLLIVVGGDGTVNEVINGLGRAGFPEDVTLAVLPMGTGNDLAATLAIPDDIEEAEEAIRKNRVRTLDVARIRSEGVGERFFINVSTGGFGAETSSLADEEMKRRWGKLTYFRASLEKARDFDVREVRVTLDGEERRVRGERGGRELPLRRRRLARSPEGQPGGRAPGPRGHRGRRAQGDTRARTCGFGEVGLPR